MSAPSVKLEFADPEFFTAAPKKLKVENDPNVGRTYFISKDRIVAVAKPEQGDQR